MRATSPSLRDKRPSRRTSGLIVLGIDPGTLVTGFGIVERHGAEMKLLACGAIKNSPEHPLAQRLMKIYSELCSVIRWWRPTEIAIESAFCGKNAQSALKLGHARGVSLLAAVERNIPISEYSPREIKRAVTGKGQASKVQVQFMVRALLGLSSAKMLSDTSDAIATAICHLHRLTAPGKKHKNWKSFVLAHPERVRS